MNAASIIIITAVLAAAVLAVIRIHRKGLDGGCGSCALKGICPKKRG